jgi:preflagellin peptidase FlaK
MYLELRIAICACMLAIASILDIKSREIPDKVWLIFGGFGAILTAIELLDTPSSSRTAFSIHYAIGIALMSCIGYATYRTCLFGGADPKALVAIAVILPTYSAGLFAFHDFAAISILSNALVVSTTAMLYNVVRNSIAVARGVPIFEGMGEGRVKRALAFAVGFPSSSPSRYVFAMEAVDDSGNRKFRFNPANYDDFAPSEQWQHKEENEEPKRRKRTWVTPALPFIVYIGIGFAINLMVGDLFALLFKLAL